MIETSYNHVLEIVLSWLKLTSKLAKMRSEPSDWQRTSTNQYRLILSSMKGLILNSKLTFLAELICSLVTLSKSLFLLLSPFFLGRIWNLLMALILFNKGQTSRTMVNPNSLFILLSSYSLDNTHQLATNASSSKQQDFSAAIID